MSGFFRDPEGIRTPDRLLRRQMLYPAELRDHYKTEKTTPKLSFLCRGGRIRTYDLLLPKQARYRATLHPETYLKLPFQTYPALARNV